MEIQTRVNKRLLADIGSMCTSKDAIVPYTIIYFTKCTIHNPNGSDEIQFFFSSKLENPHGFFVV